MTAGYWKNADLTREKIKDGWFYTGDLARRDDDDDYWFFSRKSEVIRQRGQLVSPLEVEAAFYRHPSVKEVGVAGMPDGAGGQWAVAHVVLKGDRPTGDEGTLIDFATMELGPDKAPQRVIFADRLPYGLTGKIDRRALTRYLSCGAGQNNAAGDVEVILDGRQPGQQPGESRRKRLES
jgi:acyl-coenzyme A synthetase/AMP-(fatty) acid ligase